MHQCIMIIFCLFIQFSCLGQFEKVYGNHEEFTYLYLSKNDSFDLDLPSGPTCGILMPHKGTYRFRRNKLILKIDRYYEGYEEDLNSQYIKVSQVDTMKQEYKQMATLKIRPIRVRDDTDFLFNTTFTINGKTYNEEKGLFFNIEAIEMSDTDTLPSDYTEEESGKRYRYDSWFELELPVNKQYTITAQLYDSPSVTNTFVLSGDAVIEVGLHPFLPNLSKEEYKIYKVFKYTAKELVIRRIVKGAEKKYLYRLYPKK